MKLLLVVVLLLCSFRSSSRDILEAKPESMTAAEMIALIKKQHQALIKQQKQQRQLLEELQTRTIAYT